MNVRLFKKKVDKFFMNILRIVVIISYFNMYIKICIGFGNCFFIKNFFLNKKMFIKERGWF